MAQLIIQPAGSAGEDTYLFQGQTTWNYGRTAWMTAGGWNTSSNRTNRALLKFDISSIPAGATINSATVRLRCTHALNTTGYFIQFHIALTDWWEGINISSTASPGSDGSTWNLRRVNGSLQWGSNTPGGLDGTDWGSASASAFVSVANAYYDWNVTSDVIDFFDGSLTNRGWWILGAQDHSSAKEFGTSDATTVAYRPQLIIDYTPHFPSVAVTPDPALVGAATEDPEILSGTEVTSDPATVGASTAGPQAVLRGNIAITPAAATLGAATLASVPAHYGNVEISPAYASAGLDSIIWGVNQDRPIKPEPASAGLDTRGRYYIQRIESTEYNLTPLLYITDGTVKENGQINQLNLLDKNAGYLLRNWRPTVAQYKSGGSFSENPSINGRQLVGRAFENAIEILEMRAKGHDQDRLIEYNQDLLAWQEAAADYWISNWSTRPVYLVARAARETNTRYAIIHTLSIPNLENPYSQPFLSYDESVQEEITVRIERGDWTSTPPGQSECVPINNQQEWAFNTWVSLSTTTTGNVLTFVRASNGNLLAGTDDQAKIFVSTDDGLNWSLLATLGTVSTDAVRQITVGHSGTLVAALTGGTSVKGIWRSTDNGTNWSRWVVPPAAATDQASQSVNLQPSAGAGIDTMLSEFLPTRNYGTVAQFIAGNNAANQQSKALIKFDLSAIPANATIVRAKLTLYCWYEANTTDRNFSMHRSLVQWFEGEEMGGRSPQAGQNGSTWNLRNHNGSVAWAGGAGGVANSDYQAAATDTIVVNGKNAFFTWDLEQDVQNWVDGTSPNYGWWMLGEDVANSEKGFYSSDNTNAVYRPQLLIEYAIQFAQNDGYYSVVYAPSRQEYLATGGAAGVRGLISRTINWSGQPNYENWYHSTHTNGEVFRAAVVQDEAKYGTPERFFIASSHVPGFALVMSPAALSHGPPTQYYDFDNVLPNMTAGATVVAANNSKDKGYALVGTTDGKVWRANNKSSMSTAYRSLQHIATLPGAITALYVAPPEDPGMTVYAAVGNDLYVSQNGGYIWSLVTSYPATTIYALWKTSHTILTGANESVDGYYLTGNYVVGQEDTCEAGVYVANKFNQANLTNIKRYDASLGEFENLQFTIDPPYRLFPIPPAAGDIAYFGIASSGTSSPSNPFTSLVFDILTPATDITTIAWEYWNGSAWTALTVQDNTNQFASVGLESVHWFPPTNQATTVVDGITGWWVRARVTVVGTDPIAPVVGNRYIYTVNVPYVTISSGSVTGDLPAASRIKWYNQADDASTVLNLQIDRMLCCVRSLDRGEEFNAYLNISDTQTPVGFTISKDADGTWTAGTKTATGRFLRISHASGTRLNTWNNLVTFTLDNTIARTYYGTYRAFVRVNKPTSTATVWQLRLQVSFGSGGAKKHSYSSFVTTTSDWEVIDLREITIPATHISQIGGNLGDQMDITVQGYNTTTGVALDLYDLILMPTDEWAADLITPDQSLTATSEVKGGNYLDIDSILNPKMSITGMNRNSADQIVSSYQTINNGPAVLQKEGAQRLWFLSMSYESYWRSYPYISGTVEVEKQQRYLAFRGKK